MSTRATAEQKRQERLDRPPSWRAAINRAAIAGAVFLAVLILLLKQGAGAAVGLAGFMFLVYIPMGYAMDTFIWRFRQRRKQRQTESG
jgi:hypothetical protein